MQWNATTDYNVTSNPFSAWQVGWTASLGSAFNLFTSSEINAHGTISWYDPATFVLSTPVFWKNTSTSVDHGAQPGQIALGPGCKANEYSVLRWTAPATSTCTVDAKFFAGDVGETDANILKNSTTSLYSVASTDSDPEYTGTVSVAAGDTLDFVVGVAKDGCHNDTTPLTVVITCPN